MTAVLSPRASTSSPSSQTPPSPLTPSISPSANPNHPALPPLVTSNPRRTARPRPASQMKDRLSTLSTNSNVSQLRSRPTSHAFPIFHSNLPYTLVRDFAYPVVHPLHYGPPPEPASRSGDATPVSEAQTRRLSDPSRTSWDQSAGGWSAGPWGGDGSMGGGDNVTPQILYHDGPPWSEDEDLQSPIVVTSRHKKHKSSGGALASGRARRKDMDDTHHGDEDDDHERGMAFRRRQSTEDETYYADDAETTADGPGGEFVSRPPHQSGRSYNVAGQRDSHFAATLSNRSYATQSSAPDTNDESSGDEVSGRFDDDESRYSRDYQFTIASPDEEMHGKAVALFDFARENENELPLVEGQVIWVSYRHGQGWLVAEDPKTQESGLVPEEYVRLLRDIRGGWGSLTGELAANETLSPPTSTPNTTNAPSTSAVTNTAEVGTPTQLHPQTGLHSFSTATLPAHSPSPSNGSAANAHSNNNNNNSNSNSNGYQHPPTVSMFSTSSKDLDPYPQHLLGTQQGQVPPQVVHYHGQRGGSQTNTPTLATSKDSFAGKDKDDERSGSRGRKAGLTDVTNRDKTGARAVAEDEEAETKT